MSGTGHASLPAHKRSFTFKPIPKNMFPSRSRVKGEPKEIDGAQGMFRIAKLRLSDLKTTSNTVSRNSNNPLKQTPRVHNTWRIGMVDSRKSTLEWESREYSAYVVNPGEESPYVATYVECKRGIDVPSRLLIRLQGHFETALLAPVPF